MNVVAYSSSTKTDWCFYNGQKSDMIRIESRGINPYFDNAESIEQTLALSFSDLEINLSDIEKVHFYGTGCSSELLCSIVESGVTAVLKNAKLEVEHDLLGVCRAALGTKPGIVCILATGSNSCVWDGTNIVNNIPSHGYVLGDEGSAAHLGRELLKAYFNRKMSDDLKQDFEDTFQLSEEDILTGIYKKENPNAFLASLAPFFVKHNKSRNLNVIAMDNFRQFFECRIINYPDYQSYSYGVIGSVACDHEENLMKVALEYGVRLMQPERDPINGLLSFHQ